MPVGYFDGFGMFLNDTNVAFVNGQPVNIQHPSMAAVAGTELAGVLAYFFASRSTSLRISAWVSVLNHQSVAVATSLQLL